MKTSPRVTIGMPVYNAEALVSTALDSLLGQSCAEFELIISDNASTDGTEAVCRKYAARDSRIRYVRHDVNHGSSWNFNRVFGLSNSEYFKWAAYDDICHSTFLERCVQILDEHPDVVWCHSRSRHIGVDGELLRGSETPEISYLEGFNPDPMRGQTPTRASERASDRFRAVLLGRNGCLDTYGLIRTSVLRKTGLFLPLFGSEKVLMAELGLWGRYAEIPETLFYARIHPRAAGSQRSGKLQRQFINPLAKGRLQFARLQLLGGYIAAIRRSEISFQDRSRCYASVARYLFQIHKWKSVIVKGLTGAGLSGEYPSVVKNRPAKAC